MPETACALPGDLVVKTPYGPLSVQEILSVPARAHGIWDGFEHVGAAPAGPCLTFGICWLAELAGKGFEDLCREAAILGAHLAARDPEWPGEEAHIRAWPVIDVNFNFALSPVAIPPAPASSVAAKLKTAGAVLAAALAADDAGALRELAAQTAACESGECGCGD